MLDLPVTGGRVTSSWRHRTVSFSSGFCQFSFDARLAVTQADGVTAPVNHPFVTCMVLVPVRSVRSDADVAAWFCFG